MPQYTEFQKTPPESILKQWDLLEDLLTPLRTQGHDPTALLSTSEYLRVGVKGSQHHCIPFIETSGQDSQSHQGVVFSVIQDQKRIEEATSDLCESSMKSAITRLQKRVHVQKKEEIVREPIQAFFDYGNKPLPVSQALTLTQKLRASVANHHVASCLVAYSHLFEKKVLVKNNLRLAQHLSFPQGIVYAITTDHYEYVQSWLGEDGFDHKKMNNATGWMSEISKKKSFPSGNYSVVCSGDVAGVIGHETFGHGDELDTIIAGRAKALHYIQKQVGSPLVTLIDTPSPHSFGFYAFDDDGTLVTRPTYLIKEGILSEAMNEQVSLHRAKKMGLPLTFLTPNGRRESPFHRLCARMSNTYFVPGEGKTTINDMISMVDDGFYLPLEGNGMENPKEWTLQIKVPLAIRIKKGKLTNEVYGNVLMTGDVIDILHQVSAVGSDISGEGLGYCGKERQDYVRVANKSAPFLTKVNLTCP